MKAKHTPGPWTAGITPHYLKMGQHGNPLTILSPHHTEEIATVWTCALPTEANANLIAAAPDMLEVLEKLLPKLSQLQDESAFTWPEKIEALIAKAKGDL